MYLPMNVAPRSSSRAIENDPFFTAVRSELAQLMRNRDWAATPLGPVSTWPQSLRTAVSLMLNSQHPMWIGWGPEATFLYNDAYIQVLSRAKHPWALGRPFSEVWAEIWDVCGPLSRMVFERGEASFQDDVRLFMNRGDYLEETYYSFSYSPIYDESGKVGGLFCPSAEVTSKVLNARRLRTLSELSANAFVERNVEAACASAAATLAKNPDDVPFALLYVLSADGSTMCLERTTGLTSRTDGFGANSFRLDTSDARAQSLPVAEVAIGGQPQTVSVAHIAGLPLGPAGQPVTEALILPVKSRGEERSIGILVAAVNPTRKIDDEYRTFYELIAGHVATAIANARTYQEERKRAEALAELDRAKTIFFSNISHEFRTPLTLMLGPIESAIARDGQPPGQKQELELLHRNALRMMKLVNALLDFSRIEAGRMSAKFGPVDLAAVTADLASVFRSAAEKAGLRFHVECQLVTGSVYVDREMWEKIVLNLVSNAFKSTFEGSITLTLRQSGDSAELVVSDTGTGIPEDEIPHLFERFRRIEGARRRTNEGSGIGLALVHELVEMHSGSISVQSELGVGTAFTVRIPLGSAHLPAQHISEARSVAPTNAAAYVQEALGWLPEVSAHALPSDDLSQSIETPIGPAAGTVLLADDNLDMRQYVERLLSPRFFVKTASNGREALEMATADRPDLILTDVMMPEMDGFQLLAALRSHPATSGLPVIMLSARAGEESRVEGLAAGADDYLVKPFTARELLARVESHIKMAQFRREAMEHERELEQAVEHARNSAAEAVEHISDGFWTYDSEWRITYMNSAAEAISRKPRSEQIGRTVWELFPDVLETEFEIQFRRAMGERQIVEFESLFQPWQRWYRHRLYPTPDGGLAVYIRDSTDARLTEQALRRAEQLAAAGKLAASISHEINNPLEAVTNLLFLARSAPELSAETRDQLEIADHELQRLSHIARTSLKFYRQSSAPSTIVVRDLVESVLMVFRARITGASVEVRRNFREAPPLRCFPGELQQVLTNLISNALDAVGTHGTLLVSLHASHGGKQWSRPGVRITIADTGSGMTAATRARLFEPFFTTKTETGTGLGLWVTKGIVEKHHGTIHVMSAPGKGTAMSVFFPFDGIPQ